jgi:glycosyltransferase involved in cell wall biosynthesis
MKTHESPLISVIIPVYNTGKACVALLEALLGSTHKKIEIICVDDGSKDDSLKLLEGFAKNHSKVKVFSQKNAGPSAARNTGIKHALGQYAVFIDSDDMIEPEFLSELLKAYSDDTILACTSLLYNRLAIGESYPIYTKRMRAHKKNESIKDYVLYLLRYDGRLYGVINKLFRLDIIRDNNLEFDTSIRFAEDTNFVLDYIDAATKYYNKSYNIGFIYKPLYIYNYGTETSTVAKSSLSWDGWQKSFEKLRDWASSENNLTARTRLFLVWLRWKISHALNVQRANIPKKEKLKYAGRLELFFARLVLLVRK